jgi:hypothetical protein
MHHADRCSTGVKRERMSTKDLHDIHFCRRLRNKCVIEATSSRLKRSEVRRKERDKNKKYAQYIACIKIELRKKTRERNGKNKEENNNLH